MFFVNEVNGYLNTNNIDYDDLNDVKKAQKDIKAFLVNNFKDENFDDLNPIEEKEELEYDIEEDQPV